MRQRRQEAVFAAGIVVILATGLAYDGLAHPVAPVETTNTIALHGKAFSSRALYCPPSLRQIGATTRIAVSSGAGSAVRVGFERARPPAPVPTPAAASPASSPSSGRRPTPALPSKLYDLKPGRARFQGVAPGGAVNVVGYGGDLTASAHITTRSGGAGAAGCSPVAAQHWYFPEGSSELGYDERLILYNPFPDEAVVRVSFITPKGKETKANLADQAVASGATTTVRLNDFVLKEPLLSTEVDVIRGRVVAWRALSARPSNRPRGLQFSLGATSSHRQWFFPDGALGSGYDERILLLNPNAKEARVSVSVFTSKGTEQPGKLLNISIPPASSESVAPAAAMKAGRGRSLAIGTEVNSTNGVGVVAERTVWYSRGGVRGVASEVGATSAGTRWFLGPASFDPASDSVVVLNPTNITARVSISLERDGRPALAPGRLQQVRVRAGTRVEVSVARWTSGRPVVAVVSSDKPVVAERFSYSRAARDVSALMGRPLD